VDVSEERSTGEGEEDATDGFLAALVVGKVPPDDEDELGRKIEELRLMRSNKSAGEDGRGRGSVPWWQ
jgi:hypothetical protein